MEFGNSSLLSHTKHFLTHFSIKPTITTAKLHSHRPNQRSIPTHRSSLSLLRPYFSINATLKPNDTRNKKTPMNMVKRSENLKRLMAISPLDGEYWEEVKELAPYASEYALMYYRVLVEVQWMLKLSEIPEVGEVPSFSNDARSFLRGIVEGFNEDDALEIKKNETVTNHDVKAVEYFLKQKCKSNSEIFKVLEFFHFGCTSEDINNLAQGLMLKESLDKVIIPIMDDLIKAIGFMTQRQPASPTTLGKQMSTFASRLSSERNYISQVEIKGKFAGAVGNYSAHLAAYPYANWPKIAEEFVTSLGLSFNPYVTQIEPRDYMADLFQAICRFDNILINFDTHILNYFSLGHFKQETKGGEIGLSTLHCKVKPIDFFDSEFNLCVAHTVLSQLSSRLTISRFQRDLTDSTALRNVGVGLGHALVAYKSTLRGIGELQINETSLE